MDILFRNCLILSIVIHCGAIFPLFHGFVIKQEAQRKEKIIVDYIITKEARAVEEKKPQFVKAETPKVEMKPEVKEKPAPAAPPAKKQAVDRLAKETAEKQSALKNTKDYIGYYQLIREKIRQRLKANYRRHHNEGDIALTFVLRSDGTLAASDYDSAASTRDRTLAELAQTSLKEASPFAPFPKALDLPVMSFDLTVSFKKD